jgi:hypothetical protein
MRKIFYAFAILCVLSTTACTQNSSKQATFKAVQEFCPNADIIEVERKADYIEVEFLCDNKRYEFALSLQGEIIYTETEISTQEIPFDKIEKKLKKKYPEHAVDEFALVKNKDTTFIKAELMKNGIEENTFFTLDGKWFKLKSYVVSESWNCDNLAQNSYYQSAPYNFCNPNRIIDLPDELREVSGISYNSPRSLYCIQDELGVVFDFDIETENIQNIIRFTDLGDFEGIAHSNDAFYCLRSDASVLTWAKNGDVATRTFTAQTKSLNNEGIVYDKANNALLIASKAKSVGFPENHRKVWTYTLSNIPQLSEYLTINTTDIQTFVREKYPLINETIECNPSEIALHPLTGQLYVLSAQDRLIAVYDKQALVAVYPLPAELYYKPEGITFMPDGTMILSSEGTKNKYLGGQLFIMEARK